MKKMRFDHKEAFRKALIYLLEKKGRGAQTNVAIDAKISQPQLNKVKSGVHVGTIDTLHAIAGALDTTYEEMLALGRWLMYGEDVVAVKMSERPLIIQTVKEAQKEFIDGDHFRAVPLYESGRLAAWSNGGAFDIYEKATDHVMVYLPELKHRLTHNLIAARVGGDSMSPLIPKNSIVIIDLSDKEFFDKKIYACNWHEGGIDTAVIKRVRLMEGDECCVLLSENPEYLPVVTRIGWDRLCIGRVVWMWRDLLEG
jgi:phage repressor protein C with HTH and peptisase S24 domain